VVEDCVKSMPSKCCSLSEKSTAETKQQVFAKVSWEAEGENAAAGEHLENRQGFYIYTEMRKEGESVRVRACLCVCVSRSLRRLLFKQKGTAARQQAEMKVIVLHCTGVTGLFRACRVRSYACVGPFKWEMQRTEC